MAWAARVRPSMSVVSVVVVVVVVVSVVASGGPGGCWLSAAVPSDMPSRAGVLLLLLLMGWSRAEEHRGP